LEKLDVLKVTVSNTQEKQRNKVTEGFFVLNSVPVLSQFWANQIKVVKREFCYSWCTRQ